MVPFDLPDAIVFDLDGTIVDTETVEYESIKTVWAHHNSTYTVAHFEHVIGTTEAADWIAELVDHLGRDIDVSHAHALRHETKARLLHELRARPGIGALIEQATLAGVPLAVASNSPLAWVEARLHHLALRSCLQAVITIDSASHPKPHPAPYLEACAALGARPSHSIAFEDSTTGVASARSAGLFTIAYPCQLTLGHDLSAADLVIDSLSDITLADLGRAVRR